MAGDDADAATATAYRYSWDVFLSFRGEDTRHGFIADLFDELKRQGVRPFRDDEGLERGDEIAPTLVAAIEDSAASIAVISEHYANSKWCLDELAKILDCKRLMIPVFYDVDPSNVRWQTGCFEADFEKYEREVAAEKVERWKNAMKRAGNLSGLDSRLWEKAELIQVLVKKVLKELNNTPMGVAKYPVGLNTRVDLLLKKLDVKANDVRIIGFYGMGGIGKTTLAKALYNKLIVHFKRRSFLSNVREEAQKAKGLESLQEKLISSLTSGSSTIDDTKKGINYIREITDKNPILLVLDDVDNSNQLDVLAGRKDWFHDGSRIIITSRDKDVLLNNVVDEIYDVEELKSAESLQLFSYHAFGKDQPAERFKKISEEIVSLTGGLPLVLEVFGSFLFYKRRMEEWNDALEKLKCVRFGHIQDKLEISFSSLDVEEKCVFLDIACFFVDMKMKREDAVDIFKGCGFDAELVITDLTAKSLVKVIDENVLWMHDQIREMGREIVRRESYVDAGMRSRLWDRDEILKVLKNEKGTRSIEGITINFVKKQSSSSAKPYLVKSQNMSQLGFVFDYFKKKYKKPIGQEEQQNKQQDEETLCTRAFKPMINLRLLRINFANLDGNFELIPAELKWLQWKGCPLETLPIGFRLEDLAVLDLSESKISQLWSQKWWDCYGKKMAKKLQVVNLYACRNLQKIPDLSGLCLEKLILEHCSSLIRIHRSIGDMSNLTYLNLKECKNLVKFPNDISGMKSLEKLFLSGCTQLQHLPDDMSGFKSLTELLLDRTAIVKLPDSIFRLKNLEILNLNDCSSLTILPISIGNLSSLRDLSLNGSALQEVPKSVGALKNLEKLNLGNCLSLTLLPETIGDLKSLTELYLSLSSIKNLPESIGSLSHLKFLWMRRCKKVNRLPDSIGHLCSLVSFDLQGTPITEVPDQIGCLQSLERLDIGDCQSLKFLPDSIGNLSNLKNLLLNDLLINQLPDSLTSLERLETLHLTDCKNLQRLPLSTGNMKSLSYIYMAGTDVKELPSDIGTLSNLRILKMRKKESQEDNVVLPASSSDLSLFSQEDKVALPATFSGLSLLEELDAYAFGISGKISDDFEKLSKLESLDLSYNDISSLPSSLKGLFMLKKLVLAHCKKLKCLPLLPCNLFKLNVANCAALEILPDLSELGSLQELELTNCKKIVDIPGLEKLKSLRRLYTGGCNACLSAVRRRLSKVALRRIRYLCIPGSKIPNWFVQEVPNFSCPRNRGLKGIIIGVVVSREQQEQNGLRNKVPAAIVNIQAKIIRQNVEILKTTLYLLGVPNSFEDQLYVCRYHDYNNLVFMLEEGDMLQVTMREDNYSQGITLKKHGIHLVFENDDDFEDCDEALFSDESQQSVSKRLANFFNSL